MTHELLLLLLLLLSLRGYLVFQHDVGLLVDMGFVDGDEDDDDDGVINNNNNNNNYNGGYRYSGGDESFYEDDDGDNNNNNKKIGNDVDDEFPVLRFCVLGTVFISIAGSLFHFAYEWTCCYWLVGLFVAVNESVFEHLKLLIFSILLFWIIDCASFGNRREHLIGVTAAIYSGVLFLTTAYFIWMLFSDTDQLWFDILLFVVSALVAQIIGRYYALGAVQLGVCCCCSSYVVAVPLFVIALTCYLLFTDFPPRVETIFSDPITGVFGRPLKCGC